MNQQERDELLTRIDERTKRLDERFVQLARYLPVERIVYGLVVLLCVGVMGALLRVVIK